MPSSTPAIPPSPIAGQPIVRLFAAYHVLPRVPSELESASIHHGAPPSGKFAPLMACPPAWSRRNHVPLYSRYPLSMPNADPTRPISTAGLRRFLRRWSRHHILSSWSGPDRIVPRRHPACRMLVQDLRGIPPGIHVLNPDRISPQRPACHAAQRHPEPCGIRASVGPGFRAREPGARLKGWPVGRVESELGPPESQLQT